MTKEDLLLDRVDKLFWQYAVHLCGMGECMGEGRESGMKRGLDAWIPRTRQSVAESHDVSGWTGGVKLIRILLQLLRLLQLLEM